MCHASGVDPVGACVGPRGSRVRMVVSELRGEKIDIIPFNEEPARFVAKALSPARVREVLVDDEAKQATVIVPDDQLSLAIGKDGLNARLAARLTGWRVDIRSETEFAEEEAEMGYQEEEVSGRCAAILANGKRCPNASLPGSRYCGLPAHQALEGTGTDYLVPPEDEGDEEPAEEAAGDGAVEAAVAEETVAEAAPEDTGAEEAAPEEAGAEEAAPEEAGAEEAAPEEAAPEEAAVEVTSSDNGDLAVEDLVEAAADEAPVEELPVEELPVEDAPVEEVPVEDAPVEDAPVEEAPVASADQPVDEEPVADAEPVPEDPPADPEAEVSAEADEPELDEEPESETQTPDVSAADEETAGGDASAEEAEES